jgi:hypothetical protein
LLPYSGSHPARRALPRGRFFTFNRKDDTMRSDEELMEAVAALLEVRESTGEAETDRVLEILAPYTREEAERISDLGAEHYPNTIEAEALERYLRHKRAE